MGRDFLRKCSQCGHNGHNSRTCSGKSCMIRLFGVDINADHCGNNHNDHDNQEMQDEAIRKCKSMEILPTCNHEGNDVDVGYLSDGLIHKSSKCHATNERKKGIPWSEDEHRSFLIGLEKLGKGDWKGISKNFVPSRNPTQVASHAQKYFLRASSTEKKRRRSSLFDIPFDALCSTHQAPSDATSQKTSEAQQAGTPVAAPSQLNNVVAGQQDSLLKAFLKPPLSAGASIAPQWRMPYMVGLHNNAQVKMPIPTHLAATKVAYGPVLGFPYLNQIISPNLPSSSTVPPLPFGPCQADATIKDTLDLNVVALKL